MSLQPNLPFALHLPAPSAAQAMSLLDALNATEAASDRCIELALTIPALVVALLWMAPLEPDETSLRAAIARRLSDAGTPLLRAWVLQSTCPDSNADFTASTAIHSLHLSRLTADLASAVGAHDPLSAGLAGLWLAAGELSLAASVPDYAQKLGSIVPLDARLDMEQEQLGTDHLQIAVRLAEHCGLGLEIQDAILLTRLPSARLEGAHPLARALHAATQLAEESTSLDSIAHLTGLGTDPLGELRERYLASLHRDRASATETSYPALPAPWRTTVLAGLSADIFGSLSDNVESSLARAFRLLFCAPAPLLLREEHGRLVPFATAKSASTQAMAQRLRSLELALDDNTSIVALAARTQAITTHYVGGDAPSRNTKDWHVARWLGHRSLTCLPFDIAGQCGVGIIGERDDPSGITPEQRLMAQLVQNAARSHFGDALLRHQIASHGEQIRESLMAHVRRIKHETAGPLTVLQTKLSLLATQNDGTGAPMALEDISQEVARVSELLAELTEPESTAPPQAEASINAEVGRLRELYGDTLFEQRGRRLDIRLPPSLPAVAITPKALTQVLLNLMRNAAEALPEEGTLSIRSSGVAITGGRPCVEILLKDDGPGLPNARQKALFDPAPSTKGDGHEGIGLSIVKQLLDDCGAYIFCRTIKNQGTSFQIYIPVLDC